MLNLSGKVRLGKVYLKSNYKDCHIVKVLSQELLKLTCAWFDFRLKALYAIASKNDA